ncbi:MAG TPA: hypothetical protein V6D17_22075, partial [Candidatus Obscuribacterales bacterium]
MRYFSKTAVFQLPLICALVAAITCGPRSAALSDSESDAYPERERNAGNHLTPVSLITWWSHDATGYHPSIAMWVENSTGRDLSGVLIRFQARFFDLRNGYTQIGRAELETDFRRNQQRFVKMTGPVPSELPIDKNQWPKIECKVMCRIGNVSDEGTQDLIVTRIKSITMSDEEAELKLSQDVGRYTVRQAPPYKAEAPKKKHDHHQPPPEPEKPLVATAGALHGKQPFKPPSFRTGLARLLAMGPALPGLGDDFFDFEQVFRRPRETDARDPQWTWARFTPEDASDLDVIVGSKGRTGKADILIAVVPASEVQNDGQIVALAQQFYQRKSKSDKLKGPQYSVRYVP